MGIPRRRNEMEVYRMILVIIAILIYFPIAVLIELTKKYK